MKFGYVMKEGRPVRVLHGRAVVTYDGMGGRHEHPVEFVEAESWTDAVDKINSGASSPRVTERLNLKLFNKYLICHSDGSPLKGKQYFVLRLDSDDPMEAARVTAAMAAYKEEPVGNMAAMRVALMRICETAKAWGEPGADAAITIGHILDIAESALHKPARNCDAYAKDEVRMAYHLHGDGLMTMQSVVDWLYDTSTKGDVKWVLQN